MSHTEENLNQWCPWKEWQTLILQTNRQFPEIGLLTLNRPEKLNAMNDVMIDDLNSAMDFLNHGFDCRVVVICGAGRLFCAGADLTTGFEDEPMRPTILEDTVTKKKVKITIRMAPRSVTGTCGRSHIRSARTIEPIKT